MKRKIRAGIGIDLHVSNCKQSRLKVQEAWKAEEIPNSYFLQTMTFNAPELR